MEGPFSVHEEVTLTPEGAKVWDQVADPASPVGKPVSHKARRIEEDDPCAHVTLELRALPTRPGEAPPARRLARLLKSMLRSYRFRCVKVGPPETERAQVETSLDRA